MSKQIPSASQTVGPFFQMGLQYLIDRMEEADAVVAGAIELKGRVLDRDGAAVPDAMLEFWTAGLVDRAPHAPQETPGRFRRVATDEAGSFTVKIRRPTATSMEGARMQAPHMLVLIYARGLLRHLISRVYLEDEPDNENDPVLLSVSADRRSTLIAKLQTGNQYIWNVVLQGADETVFFAW